MSKEQKPKEEEAKPQLVLRIHPGGTTTVQFFPVSFSEFIIDYVYDKKNRERMARTGARRIYCG